LATFSKARFLHEEGKVEYITTWLVEVDSEKIWLKEMKTAGLRERNFLFILNCNFQLEIIPEAAGTF
jgi:hypothetical protein